MNQFVQSVYHSIKAAKPWVKFGISPFGIWRPGIPPQIKGLDAYANLYADSRLWLASGWVDYFSPQLYWPMDQRGTKFSRAAQWWAAQNVKGRHLWPGLNDANVGKEWKPEEIARQMQYGPPTIRRGGEILFHLRSVLENRPLANIVRAEYPQPALVPASPWLDSIPPGRPKLTADESRADLDRALGTATGGKPAWLGFCNFEVNGFGRRKFCRRIKPRGRLRFRSRRSSPSARWIAMETKARRPRSRKRLRPPTPERQRRQFELAEEFEPLNPPDTEGRVSRVPDFLQSGLAQLVPPDRN